MADIKINKTLENLYGSIFLIFCVAILVSLIGNNYGSAIWLAIAASNSISLMVWAKMKSRYEVLEKTVEELRGK